MITLAPVISWRPSSLTPLTSPPAQKIVIPALSLSFPLSLCHSRSLSVIPALSLSFPRKWESRKCGADRGSPLSRG